MLEFLTPFRCSVHFRDGKTNELQILRVQCPARKGGGISMHPGLDWSRSKSGWPPILWGAERTFGHKLFRTLFTCPPREWLASSLLPPSILGCCAVDILANNTWFVFEWRTSWNMEQLKRWQFVGRLLGVARQWIWDLEKQSGAFGKTWKKPRKSGFENKLKKIFGKQTKVWIAYSYP